MIFWNLNIYKRTGKCVVWSICKNEIMLTSCISVIQGQCNSYIATWSFVVYNESYIQIYVYSKLSHFFDRLLKNCRKTIIFEKFADPEYSLLWNKKHETNLDLTLRCYKNWFIVLIEIDFLKLKWDLIRKKISCVSFCAVIFGTTDV